MADLCYFSTKTYDHSRGLSAVFRQHRAESHCRFLHGYALAFNFTFAASSLDARNWVVNFGGLKELEAWLIAHFDHTTCIAADDPELEMFQDLHRRGIVDLREMACTGCEAFAELAFHFSDRLIRRDSDGRCWTHQVEVREHRGNSAIVKMQPAITREAGAAD